MFKIIGSDNREYGPASEEVLRRWIAEGRANGTSQIQREGETGWRSLSSFPEFAAALAAGAAPPVPSGSSGSAGATGAAAPARIPALPAPAGGGWSSAGPDDLPPAGDADALASELLGRETSLDIGSCVERSWQLLQKNFWLVAAAWGITFIVTWGIGFIPYVGLPASLVLCAVLQGGLHWFYLRLSRGEPASVADIFAGFGPAIGQLILCGIISGLLIWFGLFLCLIPGIYLAVAWNPASLLILDKRLEFWPALELSRKVVTKHWFAMFGLMLVALLLFCGGLLGCGILVFITGPIASGALVEAYRRLFEAPAAASAPSTLAPIAPTSMPARVSPGAPGTSSTGASEPSSTAAPGAWPASAPEAPSTAAPGTRPASAPGTSSASAPGSAPGSENPA